MTQKQIDFPCTNSANVWESFRKIYKENKIDLTHNLKYREVASVSALRKLGHNLEWQSSGKVDAKDTESGEGWELKSCTGPINTAKFEFDKMHDEGRLEEIKLYDDAFAFSHYDRVSVVPNLVIPVQGAAATSIKNRLTEEKKRVLLDKAKNPRARDSAKITLKEVVSYLDGDTKVTAKGQIMSLSEWLVSVDRQWATAKKDKEKQQSGV